MEKIDSLSIAAIRSLLIDTIGKANSGHPGMALDITPTLYALYKDHLVADPHHPDWQNRDRIVYSAGHISALIYSMLHLTGYDLAMGDLEQFRQLESKTPGHPEYGMTAGIDATAGPLGQGISQAVGIAMAETAVSHQYKDGSKLCDHYTYCICGDGCLEEGISQEAISLAGHYKLNKLILIYDANRSTLDGPTTNSLTEDMAKRFEASEWNVIDVEDGNDIDAVSAAIGKAKQSKDAPTCIIVHTYIGFGTPKQGSHKTHGNPLSAEEAVISKKNYGWEIETPFYVPTEVYENLRNTFGERGTAAYEMYEKTIEAYKAENAGEYAKYTDAIEHNIAAYIPEGIEFKESESTRATSGRYINAIHAKCHFAFGGSADVAGSVMTNVADAQDYDAEHYEGRDVNWGIREFGMAGAQNGLLLHKGLTTYVGCFMIFSDYMKNAIRMAALENIPAIYLFSHDSVAVGEDGPTHQPIEQLAALRSMPNVDVFRPADARETVASWKAALLSKTTPTALALSRQNLPLLANSSEEGTLKGAYRIYEPAKEAKYEIIATGSEVSTAIEVAKKLGEDGIEVAVVSMPSWKTFLSQKKEYRDSVLKLKKDHRFSLEILSTFGWSKWADVNYGIDVFGASGKANDVIGKHFGWTVENIAEDMKKRINSTQGIALGE